MIEPDNADVIAASIALCIEPDNAATLLVEVCTLPFNAPIALVTYSVDADAVELSDASLVGTSGETANVFFPIIV